MGEHSNTKYLAEQTGESIERWFAMLLEKWNSKDVSIPEIY